MCRRVKSTSRRRAEMVAYVLIFHRATSLCQRFSHPLIPRALPCDFLLCIADDPFLASPYRPRLPPLEFDHFHAQLEHPTLPHLLANSSNVPFSSSAPATVYPTAGVASFQTRSRTDPHASVTLPARATAPSAPAPN